MTDQHVGPPVDPFEEVVRMPRVAPEARAAHGPAVGWLGPEASELPVGNRFPHDGSEPNRHPGRGPAVERTAPHCRRDRSDEQRRYPGLTQVEEEEVALGALAPLLAQGPVTTVLSGVGQYPVEEEVSAKPQGPDGGHAGYQRAPPGIGVGKEPSRDGASRHQD